jgi:hypothetical protein
MRLIICIKTIKEKGLESPIYMYEHSHPVLDCGIFNIIASLTGHGLTISNDCPSIPKIFDNIEIA